MEVRQPGRFGVRLVEDGDSRGGEVRAEQGQPVSGAEVFHRLGEASEGAGGGEVDGYYPLGETVPVHKAMGRDWAEVVNRTDKRGRRRVVGMVYEVVAFQALRDQLKCKEIWVVDADKWRNPDQDLRHGGSPLLPREVRSLRAPPPTARHPQHRRPAASEAQPK
ncbi:hypothetical protein ACWDBW_45045 [Streptomyces sp. NPDC001107]